MQQAQVEIKLPEVLFWIILFVHKKLKQEVKELRAVSGEVPLPDLFKFLNLRL